MARLINLFSTPVLTERWEGAERDTEALKAAILARREADPGVSLSNVLGWQSDTEMAVWGGEAAARLRDHVVARCDSFTVDVRAGGRRRFRWLAEMWGNVSPPGASNQTHCHPGSYWSAVYYVDDGYGGSDDKALGGELTFLDPRMPMIRMGAPDLRFQRPDGSRDNQESWVRPATGLLIFFPSWLMHGVRPYQGSAMRMSIAINVTAMPQLGPSA